MVVHSCAANQEPAYLTMTTTHKFSSLIYRYVQIDEPVLMRYPEKALDYGIANLDKCFANVPDDVTKVSKRTLFSKISIIQKQFE